MYLLRDFVLIGSDFSLQRFGSARIVKLKGPLRNSSSSIDRTVSTPEINGTPVAIYLRVMRSRDFAAYPQRPNAD